MDEFRHRGINAGARNQENAPNDGNNPPHNVGTPLPGDIFARNGVQANFPWAMEGQAAQPAGGSQIQTADEYADAVRQWLWQYQTWHQMNWFCMTFPFYAMSCNTPPMQFPHPGGAVPTPWVAPGVARLQPTARAPVNVPVPQNEFKIPVLWKRVMAEVIDFLILFFVKIAVTIMTIEYVGI
uniref:RDD domain-containing protein n=2 Tax=Capitella teleta TaxID=283909 RepID=X1ZV61_CAPTE